MQFLPSSGRVDTAEWIHYLGANKKAGKEARRQLHKNVASNIEQVLAATPHKRPTIWSPASPLTKTIQVRRTRYAGHCWRSRDELISDVLLWTPTYGRAKAGRPARTYIHQLCEDTGCSPEDLLEAMNEREKWREGQGYPGWRYDMMVMMIVTTGLSSRLSHWLQRLRLWKKKDLFSSLVTTLSKTRQWLSRIQWLITINVICYERTMSYWTHFPTFDTFPSFFPSICDEQSRGYHRIVGKVTLTVNGRLGCSNG